MHTAVLSSQKSTNKGSGSTMREQLVLVESTDDQRRATVPSRSSNGPDRSATFRAGETTHSRSNPESLRQLPSAGAPSDQSKPHQRTDSNVYSGEQPEIHMSQFLNSQMSHPSRLSGGSRQMGEPSQRSYGIQQMSHPTPPLEYGTAPVSP